MILNIRNKNGEEIPLFDNPYFTITDVDGMTQSDVAISSNSIADMDGDVINSQSITPRTVTITLRVNAGINPEECKRYITAIVKPKQINTLYMDYKERHATLTGVVQSISMPRFSNAVAMQFSLYCSQPLWEAVELLEAIISDITSLHYWAITPKETPDIVMGEILDANMQEIINSGDVAVGMIITIVALGAVKNPIIHREETGEFLSVGIEMKANDELIISTIKGEKSITYTTTNEEGIRETSNIIDKIVEGSKWLQLEVGANKFIVNDDNGAVNMQFSFTARERYI